MEYVRFFPMENHNKILRVLNLIGLLEANPPKNIRFLAEHLNTTERTIYRYLDLVAEIGFNVGRDEQSRWFIPGNGQGEHIRFTPEECDLLFRLVATVARKNKLHNSLLGKLRERQLDSPHSGLLLNAHVGQVVEHLSEAIQKGRQVVIKKYHSINSENIRDRHVEPIRFTDDYKSLAAYEISTGKSKLFNVERMTAVEVKPVAMKYREKHRFQTPDVFGFAPNGRRYRVEWNMEMRPAVLLKEEYPMAAPLISYDRKKKKYKFAAEVHDLKPVTRFLLGFPDEITVIGDEKLREALLKKVKRFVGKI